MREEVTRAFHTAIPSAQTQTGGLNSKDANEEEEDDFLITKPAQEITDAQAKKYRDFLLEQAGGEAGVREILGMGGLPERMIDRHQKEIFNAGEGAQGGEAGDGDEIEGGEGEGAEGKRVRTKDDDEEFLMKYVIPPWSLWNIPLKDPRFDLDR